MLKLGTQNISGLYVGEQKIKKAFVGEEMVFEDTLPVYTVHFYGIEGSDTENVLESSAHTVDRGGSVTVNPWTIAGYVFEGWYEGDTLISSNSALTYTPTKSETIIYCRYVKAYLLSIACYDFVGTATFTVNGKSYNSTVSSSGNGYVTSVYIKAGEQVTLDVVSLPDGYSFSYWLSINQYGTTAQHQNPYTFTKATRSETVALFGKAASRLPAGYTEVEYIKSTATISITTGITPSISTTKIESKWMLDQAISGNTNAFFGGSMSSGAYFVGANSGTVLTYRFQSAIGGTKTKTVTNMIGRTITIDVNYSSKTIAVDGSNASMGTVNNPSSGLYLFNYSTSSLSSRKFIGKCYYFKIYSGATLVADFVPCKNPSGTPGLYDTVRKAFYTTSINTSGITAGPAV